MIARESTPTTVLTVQIRRDVLDVVDQVAGGGRARSGFVRRAIETDFSGGAVRDNPDMNKMVTSDTALGRARLPGDIGGVVAALLSPEMSWVNAQRIEASGGQHL